MSGTVEGVRGGTDVDGVDGVVGGVDGVDGGDSTLNGNHRSRLDFLNEEKNVVMVVEGHNGNFDGEEDTENVGESMVTGGVVGVVLCILCTKGDRTAAVVALILVFYWVERGRASLLDHRERVGCSFVVVAVAAVVVVVVVVVVVALLVHPHLAAKFCETTKMHETHSRELYHPKHQN